MSVLTQAELTQIAKLLDEAEEQFSNHGCNDYGMPDTLENRAMCMAVMVHEGWDEPEVHAYEYNGEKYVMTLDYALMRYLASRAREAAQGGQATE